MLIISATDIKNVSVQILVAVAALLGYRIWTKHLVQAYLQRAQSVMRKVYVRARKEFQSEAGELLELLKPVVCLTESGDYLHATMTRHLAEDLHMRLTGGDLPL